MALVRTAKLRAIDTTGARVHPEVDHFAFARKVPGLPLEWEHTGGGNVAISITGKPGEAIAKGVDRVDRATGKARAVEGGPTFREIQERNRAKRATLKKEADAVPESKSAPKDTPKRKKHLPAVQSSPAPKPSAPPPVKPTPVPGMGWKWKAGIAGGSALGLAGLGAAGVNAGRRRREKQTFEVPIVEDHFDFAMPGFVRAVTGQGVRQAQRKQKAFHGRMQKRGEWMTDRIEPSNSGQVHTRHIYANKRRNPDSPLNTVSHSDRRVSRNIKAYTGHEKKVASEKAKTWGARMTVAGTAAVGTGYAAGVQHRPNRMRRP